MYDEDLGDALKQVLKKLKTSESDVVSLVEDESGYGNSQTYVPAKTRHPREDDLHIRTMFFPRDISHLRNAYREAVQEAKQKDGSSQSSLPFTLKDTKNGEDSLPLYAEVQSAQSQNAALQELLLYLRRSRVRLARIAATNPLDMLFLVQVLHEHYPDLRVLLTSADLMLVQEADIQHITGALVLAPNEPIPTRATGGTGPVSVQVDTTSEGVLEAMSTLLRTDPQPALGAAAPVSLKDRVWLMQATRSGFAPLAVYPIGTASNPVHVADPMPLPSRFWFVSMNALSFLGLGLSLTTLYSFYARSRGKRVPYWLEFFELQSNYAANPGRAFFLAGLYVCLSAIVVLELQP